MEVSFVLYSSDALTNTEKVRLMKKLASRVSSEGTLMLSCGETRSQHRNKTIVIKRLVALLEENLKVSKIRMIFKKNSIEECVPWIQECVPGSSRWSAVRFERRELPETLFCYSGRYPSCNVAARGKRK